MSELPNSSKKYGVLSVVQHYSHSELTKKIDLISIEKDYILKILRDIDTKNAAVVGWLPGDF